MAVFKCKMCGGDLEILDNATVCECEYCGTKQTLPKLNDEKRIQLYDRANYFRRENEFDKAMGIYEMILSEANDDAESYWGIVLCRYGIEYVEDPRTHRRIPTVNRAQFTSIFEDEDYKKSIQYADLLQKEVYEAEATVIDKIQKGILDISNKEEPFDVFICYKESDENGQRTKDSVYAQSIYDWLTKQGYKVFFSRITLEDKLGSAYEPYIFAALNSARVMLVVGTKKEHFNAIWVKNEWSRYLSLIKAGKEKTLIPVYKDISPYDLPEEFQYLQAQDMNKIGFSQDLGRGIRKLIPINEPEVVKEKVVVNQAQNSNIDPLLKRVFIFLEDGDFNSANEYCEKVLDIDPENAEAYLGKLMVDLRVSNRESLKNVESSFDDNNNYQKAIRFADGKLCQFLEELTKVVEDNKKERLYKQAVAYSSMNDIKNLEYAINIFEMISTWKDSVEKKQECCNKIETLIATQEKNRIEQEKWMLQNKQMQVKSYIDGSIRPIYLMGIIMYASSLVSRILNFSYSAVTTSGVFYLMLYIGTIIFFVISLKKAKTNEVKISKGLTLFHSVGFIYSLVGIIVSFLADLQNIENIGAYIFSQTLTLVIFAIIYLLPVVSISRYFKKITQSSKVFCIISILLSAVIYFFSFGLMLIAYFRDFSVFKFSIIEVIIHLILQIVITGFVLKGVVGARSIIVGNNSVDNPVLWTNVNS